MLASGNGAAQTRPLPLGGQRSLFGLGKSLLPGGGVSSVSGLFRPQARSAPALQDTPARMGSPAKLVGARVSITRRGIERPKFQISKSRVRSSQALRSGSDFRPGRLLLDFFKSSTKERTRKITSHVMNPHKIGWSLNGSGGSSDPEKMRHIPQDKTAGGNPRTA